MLANPLGQLLANASQLADPAGGTPEHLHQLRVGLRRLRALIKVYADLSPPELVALAPALAALFGKLGAARDLDAMAESLWPALRAASAPLVELPSEVSAGVDIAALLGEQSTQRLWLDLLGFCQPASGAPDPAGLKPRQLRRLLAEPLRALQRQVRRDADRFDRLDDEARHRLRRRIKRLRYAAELGASLWPVKTSARFMRGLQKAQTPLGEFNDLVVAQTCYLALAQSDPRAWFAVGWLSARRPALEADCALALARLAGRRSMLD
jgi:CHAD domain-containing protein